MRPIAFAVMIALAACGSGKSVPDGGPYFDIACGTGACPAQSFACCVGGEGEAGFTCQELELGACAPGAYSATCDGPEDCDPGQTCCMDLKSGTQACAASCDVPTQIVCHTEKNCPSGMRCCANILFEELWGYCQYAEDACPG